MDLNRATILGRLTRDPEVRTTTGGKNVTNFAVATSRSWTDQSGSKQEQVEYHDCVLWGKLADIAAQYLSKGRRVYLEGRIQTRDWVGNDGVKKYRTEIIADNMIMLDGGQRSGNAPAPGAGNATPPPAPPAEDEIKVEDIPF